MSLTEPNIHVPNLIFWRIGFYNDYLKHRYKIEAWAEKGRNGRNPGDTAYHEKLHKKLGRLKAQSDDWGEKVRSEQRKVQAFIEKQTADVKDLRFFRALEQWKGQYLEYHVKKENGEL